MNCVNCGAAMELIESRRYFFCRHCGSFHFPEPISAEGIRVLGRAGDSPPCPLCKAPLAAALPGRYPSRSFLRDLPGITAATRHVRARRQCPARMGVESARGSQAVGPRRSGRKLSCPSCGTAFDTSSYYGPGNVVIDRCEPCDIVWLDFGELRQIVDAPGRDRGTRDRVFGREVSTFHPAPQGVDLTAADPLGFLFDLLS
ncbi:MAG: zf-TFIIB domain-containing protein [Acidobacteria bacterium]|nr:zf-TFIIB domain-containing protein [Acidobacteriota bacterium]